MKKLSNVTLLGLDCVNVERLKLVADICQKDFEFGSIKLLSSIKDDDPRIIPIDSINSKEEYSKFLIKKLNDFVDTEFVLIIQYDGFILNPNAWTDEFLKYDYIGAPWWYDDEYNVGNGGFSLRSKKLLDILQKDNFIQQFHPEDHCICRIYGDYLKKQGIVFAPELVASKFSIEGSICDPSLPIKYGSVWTNEFGFHGIDKTDISKWTKENPEWNIM
ncbi:MAG: DUF5672 family protein [Candidatus Paceibacterota bacterium]|jgi:hypothetical protein